MREYAVIIERGNSSYGAYVPDLPGCVAAAETETEVRQLIREAIELHVKAMVEDGEPVPEPTSKVEYVALPLAV
jgi:predicted RNase H-like HicB family nuclease